MRSLRRGNYCCCPKGLTLRLSLLARGESRLHDSFYRWIAVFVWEALWLPGKTGRLIAAAQKNKDPENISAASASIVISATDIEAAASTSTAETAAEAAVSTQTA